MSRMRRERHLLAASEWPRLYQLLETYRQQDRPTMSGAEGEIDDAVANQDFDGRRRLVDEWHDWNQKVGWKENVAAFLNDGFGVNVHFETAADARKFMNQVYDKLIVSIRAEVGRNWAK